MLTSEQLRLRENRLTASRVGILMHGSERDLLDLWREFIGDPSFQPEDLSGVWAIKLGEASEALNLSWYERKTGHKLTRHGEVAICPAADWAAATLDAWDDAMPGPIDAKHVGGFEPREKIVARYTPQMFWQMIVTGARWSALSIIEGAREPVVEPVLWDEAYAAELWRRAEAFMTCVESLTPPVALAPAAAPVPPEKWRTVDMHGRNEWASLAADWLSTKSAAKIFEKASKELKTLIEPDVGHAYGHGLQCKRAKNGNLTISEHKGA